MMNPDGVIIGNFRTSFAGRDLNRQFKNNDPSFYPTVHYLKKLVHSCKEKYKENVIAFYDLHGHSLKRNIFSYGPSFPEDNINHYKAKLFPMLLEKKTEMFRYLSCTFKIGLAKMTTARASLFYDFEIPNVYTFEASVGQFVNKNNEIIDFTDKFYSEMGRIIGEVTHQFLDNMEKFEKAKIAQKFKEG